MMFPESEYFDQDCGSSRDRSGGGGRRKFGCKGRAAGRAAEPVVEAVSEAGAGNTSRSSIDK
jgi:hypothetical protein